MYFNLFFVVVFNKVSIFSVYRKKGKKKFSQLNRANRYKRMKKMVDTIEELAGGKEEVKEFMDNVNKYASKKGIDIKMSSPPLTPEESVAAQIFCNISQKSLFRLKSFLLKKEKGKILLNYIIFK